MCEVLAGSEAFNVQAMRVTRIPLHVGDGMCVVAFALSSVPGPAKCTNFRLLPAAQTVYSASPRDY